MFYTKYKFVYFEPIDSFSAVKRAKLLKPTDWLMKRAFFLNSGGKITWP